MSLSPRDLDFMEAKHASAREIALAIGVPPMLLGMLAWVLSLTRRGDRTYSNYAEARPERSGGKRCCRWCSERQGR